MRSSHDRQELLLCDTIWRSQGSGSGSPVHIPPSFFEVILWKVFKNIWEGWFGITHHELLYRVPESKSNKGRTRAGSRTHTQRDESDMCNCQMSFSLCLWVRCWFPAYSRSLIVWPAESSKSKWSCQCWVSSWPSCRLLIPVLLETWFISVFIIVLALVFSSAFGVFVVYSLRGKLSLEVISIWSAEGEAQNFAPDSDFQQTEHMPGRRPRKEMHKTFGKQNTVTQKQKESVTNFSPSFLRAAGWHACSQSAMFSRQNQMKTLSQLVIRIQTSCFLVCPILRKVRICLRSL